METARPRSGRWTAIVLAGRRPERDALREQFGVANKSLIPIDGEAMLSRVLRTLTACDDIGRILILSQDVAAILADPALAWVADEPHIAGRVSSDGISRSVQDALAEAGACWPVLLTTADSPLLTPEIVARFLRDGGDCDLAVGMVARGVLLGRYPEAARSWLRFGDGDFTGANLFALKSPLAMRALALWERAERDRKSLVKVAARFGPLLLLRVALRRSGVGQVLAHAGRRLGLSVRPVLLPFADAGIDVDKPSDHRLAERILRARRGAQADLE